MTKNQYNVRIDGQVMPDSYSYEELIVNGILDFEDIEVKNVNDNYWRNVKDFYFPEEHDDASNYEIDECGQIVNHGAIHLCPTNLTTTTPSQNSNSTTNNSNINTGNDKNTDSNSAIWVKVIWTIVLIFLAILLSAFIPRALATGAAAIVLSYIWCLSD